jgi:hypothetical protein
MNTRSRLLAVSNAIDHGEVPERESRAAELWAVFCLGLILGVLAAFWVMTGLEEGQGVTVDTPAPAMSQINP